MSGWADTELARLLSSVPPTPADDGPTGEMPNRLRGGLTFGVQEEPSGLRGHLLAVVEALREEQQRLADVRRAAESEWQTRMQQLQQDWQRQRQARFRQLAETALTQARRQVRQDRQRLEAAERQLQSAESELRQRQEKFDRDRQAWEEYRRRQQEQLDHERATLAHEIELQKTILQRERNDQQKSDTAPTDAEQTVADTWYSDKLAEIRQMLSATAARRPPAAIQQGPGPDDLSDAMRGRADQ